MILSSSQGADMRHANKQGNSKTTRPSEGMEIIRSGSDRARAEHARTPRKPSRNIGAFAIVETVTGPVAGTFGLSDVWERS